MQHPRSVRFIDSLLDLVNIVSGNFEGRVNFKDNDEMGMTMSMEIPCQDQYLEKDLQQYIESLQKPDPTEQDESPKISDQGYELPVNITQFHEWEGWKFICSKVEYD
eukprot:UN04475